MFVGLLGRNSTDVFSEYLKRSCRWRGPTSPTWTSGGGGRRDSVASSRMSVTRRCGGGTSRDVGSEVGRDYPTDCAAGVVRKGRVRVERTRRPVLCPTLPLSFLP